MSKPETSFCVMSGTQWYERTQVSFNSISSSLYFVFVVSVTIGRTYFRFTSSNAIHRIDYLLVLDALELAIAFR